jgi:hypothetical protein
MASKFVLDTGQLDTDYLTTPPTLILDSTNRGKLDTNVLSSGEPIVVNDVATSVLGGLSATVQSTPQIIVSASANLGAISSIAQTGVTHFASGATSFGNLDATANTTPTILPTFDAQLGSLLASVNAVTTITAQAVSSFGSLTASSTATPEIDVTASAALGSLTASATATQPEPPAPALYGSNGYVPIKKKEVKKEPVFVPEIPEIVDTPELEPLIKSVFAKGSSDLFGLYAQSGNRIDFSILADEAEILSLL